MKSVKTALAATVLALAAMDNSQPILLAPRPRGPRKPKPKTGLIKKNRAKAKLARKHRKTNRQKRGN